VPLKSVDLPGLLPPGMSLRMGSDRVRWLWPAGSGNKPLPGANELMYRKYCDRLSAQRLQLENQRTMVDEVGDILSYSHDFTLSIEDIAQALHMSSRSLQRTLRSHGTSYREIHYSARIAAAKRMISTTRLSVSEIAWRLSYADVGSFCYAFKSATALTPSNYRRVKMASSRSPVDE
jgi:AraC-like DNA-binding protein